MPKPFRGPFCASCKTNQREGAILTVKPQNNAQDRMVRMTDQEFTELTTFVKSKYGKIGRAHV